MNAKKELEDLEKQYFDAVCNLAEREFKRVILPYLQKRGLSFLAGNGTYLIYKKGERGFIDIDDLPIRIRETLQLETFYASSDLGCLMPDYEFEKG